EAGHHAVPRRRAVGELGQRGGRPPWPGGDDGLRRQRGGQSGWPRGAERGRPRCPDGPAAPNRNGPLRLTREAGERGRAFATVTSGWKQRKPARGLGAPRVSPPASALSSITPSS